LPSSKHTFSTSKMTSMRFVVKISNISGPSIPPMFSTMNVLFYVTLCKVWAIVLQTFYKTFILQTLDLFLKLLDLNLCQAFQTLTLSWNSQTLDVLILNYFNLFWRFWPLLNISNLKPLQQKVSLYAKWFHWIMNEFTCCNERDLMGK